MKKILKRLALPILISLFSAHGNIHLNGQGKIEPEKTGKTFIINTCVTDLNQFRDLVKAASLLKKYGSVQINIGTVADKAFYEIPKGGNPWNEYASHFANLYKFYPDKRIAPFVPSDFVAKNKQLLLDKAKILRESGIEAAFFSNEPEFIPAEFFESHPDLRGPRVDHPRRSNYPFFSPCMSMKEMQEIYAGMMAELLKNVPEIKTFYFKTNDAGSGNCWSDWLYTGPNGPDHCKLETTGKRIQNLMNALQAGASKAGQELDVYLANAQGTSNFTEEERNDIQRQLPEHCFFANTPKHEFLSVGNSFSFTYPVRGIMNMVSTLEEIGKIDPNKQQTIFISFNAFYNREDESIPVKELLFKMIDDHLRSNATKPVSQKLQDYCKEWVGENQSSLLYNAFNDLEKAEKFRRVNLGNLYGIYWSVSSRMMTRPLVAVPQRLSKEEESYFLPFIFNVSQEEARIDYLDINGGRWTTNADSVKVYVNEINRISNKIETAGSASGNIFLMQLTSGLKIHACLVRSMGNYKLAQELRDSNALKLNGNIHRPNKNSTWTGDIDLLKFNEVMRDELDNNNELIGILNHYGLSNLCLAKDAVHEDCFLLGPDILNQLTMKSRIMLRHWRDIEDYLTSPFK